MGLENIIIFRNYKLGNIHINLSVMFTPLAVIFSDMIISINSLIRVSQRKVWIEMWHLVQ